MKVLIASDADDLTKGILTPQRGPCKHKDCLKSARCFCYAGANTCLCSVHTLLPWTPPGDSEGEILPPCCMCLLAKGALCLRYATLVCFMDLLIVLCRLFCRASRLRIPETTCMPRAQVGDLWVTDCGWEGH